MNATGFSVDLDDTINAVALSIYCSNYWQMITIDNSDLGEPIRHIDSINTLYLVARETAKPNKVENEHLYSASANEIDEKKPELKNMPHHLEYTYLHRDKYFPIIISSELSKKEKMLLLQGLTLRLRIKKGAENLAADHLSRLENPDLGTFTEGEIADKFPNKHLMILKTKLNDDEPCALITGRKVYESGFFWPSIFKDAKDYMLKCDACQRSRNISSRGDMPSNNIQIGLWKRLSLACGDRTQRVLGTNQCNMDLTATLKNYFMELNELMELRDGAYENTQIYKERTKRWHDSRLRGDKNFKVGDKVLLFNSRFKMHPGKLKSRWYGPNVVKTVYSYGTVEITDKNKISFKVNGQRLKKYHDEHIDVEDKVVEFEEDTT
ncbi:hypothetical protein Tco_0561874 [Tanacetum coccineum]